MVRQSVCELNLSSTDESNGAAAQSSLLEPGELEKIRQPDFNRVLRHYFYGLDRAQERGMVAFIFTPRPIDDNKSACDFACPQLFRGIQTSRSTTPEKAIAKAEKKLAKLMAARGCVNFLQRDTKLE
ncbi:hypothetical protein [Kiloniella sp. b19]|uniref:hypothetical protein n=1 Tax=Kiloniella sp. GXU_MW_B19 TaxID=3141326 RepID=UPI0031E0D7C6